MGGQQAAQGPGNPNAGGGRGRLLARLAAQRQAAQGQGAQGEGQGAGQGPGFLARRLAARRGAQGGGGGGFGGGAGFGGGGGRLAQRLRGGGAQAGGAAQEDVTQPLDRETLMKRAARLEKLLEQTYEQLEKLENAPQSDEAAAGEAKREGEIIEASATVVEPAESGGPGGEASGTEAAQTKSSGKRK